MLFERGLKLISRSQTATFTGRLSLSADYKTEGDKRPVKIAFWPHKISLSCRRPRQNWKNE